MLFLDFDGVICDSVEECLISSWVAYHRFVKHENPSSIRLAAKQQFYRLRPYVLDAEDYTLIQRYIEEGTVFVDEEEYYRARARFDKETLKAYHDAFFLGRNEVLSIDANLWYDMHKPFLGMLEALKHACAFPNARILSAKRPDYIKKLFMHWGVRWEEERIHYPRGETKLQCIYRLLEAGEGRKAVFIDDQIEHLIRNEDPRVSCCLAGWGYIMPLAKLPDHIRYLGLQEAVDLILTLR